MKNFYLNSIYLGLITTIFVPLSLEARTSKSNKEEIIAQNETSETCIPSTKCHELGSCCSLLIPLTTHCAHTSICEPDTISQPGAYCLCQDIEGIITIDSDDVDLDLNNYRIFGDFNGIIIAPGRQRVRVHNGSINNTTEQAIIVGDGSRFITLDNLEITDVATGTVPFAIDFQGSTTGRIADCIIQNVTIGRSQGGILLLNTDTTKVEDCHIQDCLSLTNTVIGIFIGGGFPFATGNEIRRCTIDDLSSPSADVAGILLALSFNTVIEDTTINNLIGQFYSAGIQTFVGVGTSIKNCVISTIRSSGTSLPCAGLYLQDSPQTIIEDCRAFMIGLDSSAPITVGLYANSSGNSIISNFGVVNVGLSPIAMGIWIEGGNAFVLRSCACENIMAESEGYGFNLLGSNILCQDCVVHSVNGSNAIGYDAGGVREFPFTDIALKDCHCMEITGELEARGFRINSAFGYLTNCDVETVLVPNAESGTISRGYDIVSTSTEVLLNACVVSNVRFPNAGEGFNVEGFSTQLQNCTAANTAIGILVPLVVSPTTPTIDQCRVTYCSTAGISIDASSSAIVTNSYAANNNTNYVGSVPNQAAAGTLYGLVPLTANVSA